MKTVPGKCDYHCKNMILDSLQSGLREWKTIMRRIQAKQASDHDRIHIVLLFTCIGLVAGILLSFKLWTNSRFFPLTPIWSPLPSPEFPVDYFWITALLLLIGYACIAANPRKIIGAICIGMVPLMFLDQARLQPWAYQYLFLLCILATYSWRKEKEQEQRYILSACGLAVASVYFWSGFWKIHPWFVSNVYLWMISDVAQTIPTWLQFPLHALGYAVPFIEMSIGIGLFFRTSRIYALISATVMCMFIFWTIGPTGLNWNAVVWPWDLTLLLLTLTLFRGQTSVSARSAFDPSSPLALRTAIFLFCALPILSMFGLWDSYLSFAVYSGATKSAEITITESVYASLPSEIRAYVDDNHITLRLTNWTMHELHTTPYPEERIFRSAGNAICAFASQPQDVQLTIFTPHPWHGTTEEQQLNCGNMQR
jgi:hypothetical protein